MPRLKFTSGVRAGTEFEFDANVVIGRGPLADLSLEAPTVSRRHAMLTWSDRRCFLSDLDSENGTFVNKQRVREPTRLGPGDVVNVGGVLAEFELDDTTEIKPQKGTTVELVEDQGSAPLVVDAMNSMETTGEFFLSGPQGAAARDHPKRVIFLSDMGQILTEGYANGDPFSPVLDRLLGLLNYGDRAFVLLHNPETGKFDLQEARTKSGHAHDIRASKTLIDGVVERRQGVLVRNAPDDSLFGASESLIMNRVFSAICAPLMAGEDLLGVIQIETLRPIPFERPDLALVVAAAGQLGMYIANIRMHEKLVARELLERDLDLAHKIQQAFLPPRPPGIAGYTFWADSKEALSIGGDFYDFFDLSDDRLGIVVGDVSGKGVSAALYGARLGSEIRYLAKGQDDPARILGEVNLAMKRHARAGMFATVAMLALEPASGALFLASAGHLLPLIRRADGRLETFGEPKDPLLAGLGKIEFHTFETRLEPGDVCAVFTDGITEALNERDELFGDDRLEACLRRAKGSVEVIRDEILVAVRDFVGTTPQSDDLTLLVFGRVEV